MASTQSTTFGATIVSNTQSRDELCAPSTLDSPALTPAVSRADLSARYQDKSTLPVTSPFYQHPPASFERAHSRQTSKENVTAFEKDIESGNLTPLSAKDDENPFTNKISVEINKECKMWPSKQTLMQQRKSEKKQKRERKGCTGCAPLRNRWEKFDKRQRLLIKIAIALLIIGILVAIGVGISKAVGGSYWARNGTQQAVGQ
jgi:hypothetical protein